jgi:GTP-binding protein
VDSLDRDVVDVEKFEEFVAAHDWELIYISAYTGENTEELIQMVADRLEDLPPLRIYEAEISEEEEAAKAAVGKETTITRDSAGVFVVEGEWLFNLLERINLNERDSLMFFQRMLIRGGVIERLREAGCEEGDTVRMCGAEFDFVE